ncbi:hypothetical protein NEOLEDRAFT_1134577 [Neolentinus lepideus HHB14362 ss-1]|uniref:DUF6534 domain-containing protein n=1 Tax=Neolentinus lepideus HHB14362 ss-1 TaxID=1314782 RepID=A0A165SAG0_9AGAM|nr:hypothetical protein NEOLEDRAFT_1134577 [Neolentinus lepideus HHB14362 ss-1]
MAPLPGVPSNIVGIEGPLLLGYLFAYLLQGVLMLQVFLYMMHYPKDRISTKAIVWSVLLLETIATAFATNSAWDELVSGWGDPDTLLHPAWSFSIAPAVCGLTASIVQLFFTTRMTVFSKNRILPIVTVLISLTAFAMSVICTVKLFTMPDLTHLRSARVVASIWLAGSAFCDVTIAVSLVYLIKKAKKRTTFKSTNSLLYRLMRLVIESGTTTALTSILHVSLFLGVNNNGHFLLMYMTAKLYSNTLLANLNARRRIRMDESSMWHEEEEENSSGGVAGTRHGLATMGRTTVSVPAVYITTTQQVNFDNETNQSDVQKIDESKEL